MVSISLTSPQFDTYLYLVGPAGTLVAENDDSGISSNSRIPAGSGMMALPAAGVYAIEVTSYSTNTFGAFTLALDGDCVPPRREVVRFDTLEYITDPDANGVRLLAGLMSAERLAQIGSAIAELPLPAFPNQLFCGALDVAPGVKAEVFVPTAAERIGDYSQSGPVLWDPATRRTLEDGTEVMDPFPGSIVPVARLQPGGLFAWRLASLLPSSTTKVGVYSAGRWQLDSNGNGVLSPGVDQSFDWGWAETTPVHGDWNGDGKDEAGFFINGLWYLDYNGNGVWDGEATEMYAFGMAGVEPKVGDWNGDGKDEIGIYIDGFWFLDMNGDGVWNGEPSDKMIIWGFVGSTPVTGDWNGDGRTKVGLYKDGLWYLDVDGNGIWDGGTTDKMIAWGWTGTTPVHGDWNGDGKEEVGVYLDGFWFLDMDGNGTWDGGTTDKMIILGWSGTLPVVGDWNGDGKTKVGTYINGYWYLDHNGNGVWDGDSTDKAYLFGQAGDTPVIGRW
jgi:hypothetical protein